jgi:hypothetical protein
MRDYIQFSASKLERLRVDLPRQGARRAITKTGAGRIACYLDQAVLRHDKIWDRGGRLFADGRPDAGAEHFDFGGREGIVDPLDPLLKRRAQSLDRGAVFRIVR